MDKMRADFEAYMREQGHTDDDLKKPYDGRYFWKGVADRWEGWQAALASSATPVSAMKLDALLPLPDAKLYDTPGGPKPRYTAIQMRDYALKVAAIQRGVGYSEGVKIAAQSSKKQCMRPSRSEQADLSKAILAIPDGSLFDPDVDYNSWEKGLYYRGFRDARGAAAALAKQVLAQEQDKARMDFIEANPHMYFNVNKKGTMWRYGHFSNYPQEDYKTAREALDAVRLAQLAQSADTAEE